MTAQACVTGCGRPTQDVLMLCPTCLWGLECDLGDVGALMAEFDTTLARLAVLSSPNDGGRTAEKALPIHAGAYEAKLTLETQLVGWVRDLAERHGETIEVPGPSMAHVAGWLLKRLYRIATHPAAQEIHDEITTSVEKVRRIIDRPPEREFVGVCDFEACPGWLYARSGSNEVRCLECGTMHPVDESRQRMMDALADRLMTAGEIAGLATHYGVERRRAMKLMATWVRRHRLVASGIADGQPTYPFGIVLSMLLATPTRSRLAG